MKKIKLNEIITRYGVYLDVDYLIDLVDNYDEDYGIIFNEVFTNIKGQLEEKINISLKIISNKFFDTGSFVELKDTKASFYLIDVDSVSSLFIDVMLDLENKNIIDIYYELIDSIDITIRRNSEDILTRLSELYKEKRLDDLLYELIEDYDDIDDIDNFETIFNNNFIDNNKFLDNTFKILEKEIIKVYEDHYGLHNIISHTLLSYQELTQKTEEITFELVDQLFS